MGMRFEIFLGLGRILECPIGMCILEAYFSKSEICGRLRRFLTDSGLRVFLS
jgi:hypothetical protein